MPLLRRLLLAGSTNAWLRERASRSPLVRRSVRRFMPGERLDDALAAAESLRLHGIGTILTALGESLERPDDARQVTAHYLDVIDRLGGSGLDAHVSVKPTQLGLDLDRALCEAHLHQLIDRAEARGIFLWIDMEYSRYVDPTLELFRAARARSRRVGVALQAYLYRTAEDLERLLPLGPAIRIVKGAYLEPPDRAYPRRADVDENFFRLCRRLLSPEAVAAGSLLHVATHDAPLAERVARYAREHAVPRQALEFAMLYGIGVRQQHDLAARGERVRVLVSYGERWFPWYMRRLAERPANVLFVLKHALR